MADMVTHLQIVQSLGSAACCSLQMATNLLWPIVFYRLHRVGWALACSSLHQILLWYTCIFFHWTVGTLAARLLLPCIAYAAFHFGWNHSVWKRNQPRWQGSLRLKLAEATARNMGPPSGHWPGSAGSANIGQPDNTTVHDKTMLSQQSAISQ